MKSSLQRLKQNQQLASGAAKSKKQGTNERHKNNMTPRLDASKMSQVDEVADDAGRPLNSARVNKFNKYIVSGDDNGSTMHQKSSKSQHRPRTPERAAENAANKEQLMAQLRKNQIRLEAQKF